MSRISSARRVMLSVAGRGCRRCSVWDPLCDPGAPWAWDLSKRAIGSVYSSSFVNSWVLATQHIVRTRSSKLVTPRAQCRARPHSPSTCTFFLGRQQTRCHWPTPVNFTYLQCKPTRTHSLKGIALLFIRDARRATRETRWVRPLRPCAHTSSSPSSCAQSRRYTRCPRAVKRGRCSRHCRV